jgi:hypothetical protein
MNRDHCPICKSKNIRKINFLEVRSAIKDMLSPSNVNNLPEDVKNMLSNLKLDEDMSDEDINLLNAFGSKIICTNCGLNFYEMEDMSEYEKNTYTPVSREEYISYLREKPLKESTLELMIEKTSIIHEYYLEEIDYTINDLNETGLYNSNSNETNYVN